MPRFLSLLFLPLMFLGQNTNREDIKPYDDGEVYNVYSAVLGLEKSDSELLIADTTVPFSNCLDPRSDKLVDAAIDDYKRINRSRWRLGYHFEIKQPYKLLSAKEADALLQPDKRTGAWPLSPSDGIHHFSAVGFSTDKSIVFVEMDVACGGLCGHGNPFILQKKKGKWIRYSPASIQNPDGTITMPGASSCGWYY